MISKVDYFHAEEIVYDLYDILIKNFEIIGH